MGLLSFPLILFAPSSSKAVPSWKVLPLLHKLRLEQAAGSRKREEKREIKQELKNIVGK